MSVLFYQPNSQALVRMFCFPFAGGNAAVFKGWGRALPKWLDICPVELPGHGSRYNEPFIRDIKTLMQTLINELNIYFDRPFIFFGHSFGALISLSLAHLIENRLQNSKAKLLSVIVSGRPEPSHALMDSRHQTLDDQQFLQWLSRFGGIPTELMEYPELMELALPVLRNDVMLIDYLEKTQKSLPPLSTPLMAISGTDEPDFDFTGLAAWKKYTKQWLGAYQITGGHFYFQTPSAFNSLSQLICMHCDNVCARYI